MFKLDLLRTIDRETRVVETLPWVKQTCMWHRAACGNRALYRQVIGPILQHSLVKVAVNIGAAADSRGMSCE